MKAQIKMEIEAATSPVLEYIKDVVETHDADTRDMVARTVRQWGLDAHVGGHHVAVIGADGKRAAIITGNTPDWN